MSEPDPMNSPSLEHRSLLWLVVGMSAAFAMILLPFLGATLWALFIAIVFYPLHLRILKQTGGRHTAAALLTLMLILLIVILPVILVTMSIIKEVASLVQHLRSGSFDPGQYVQQVLQALPAWARSLLDRYGIFDLAGLQTQITALLTSSSQLITTRVLGLGQLTLDFVIALFVMLYLLFFLLRDSEKLSIRVAQAVPLEEWHTERLMGQFVTVVRATVKGNIVIAVLQGTLGAVAFAVLGMPGVLLWGTLMALLSLLPAVGAALVWVPVAIWLLATGQILQGIGLTLWGVLVIGLVDNLLRPILVGKDTRMPDYLVLLATLGGISVFGINGLVVGPLIAAMFLVAWNLFTTVRRGMDGPPHTR